MKNNKQLNNHKIKQIHHSSRFLSIYFFKKLARTTIPLVLALLLILLLFLPPRLAGNRMPQVHKGILDLTLWGESQAFALQGQWLFYPNQLLNHADIDNQAYIPILMQAPGPWNSDKMNISGVTAVGNATYHLQVAGAQAGKLYGIRIENIKNAYRLYVNNVLIAQNGRFGDDASAPASEYRPQLVSFIPDSSSFDLVMEVSGNFYGVGGMLEPIMFGTYTQITSYDRKLSNMLTYAITVQAISCLFYIIFYIAQPREKEALVLSILAAAMLLRLSVSGDGLFMLFPTISAGWLLRFYLLCIPWTESLLLYFLYITHDRLVPKWQVMVLLVYSIAASFFILSFPLYMIATTRTAMDAILLLTMALVIFHSIQAAWRGYSSTPVLLFALSLTSILVIYKLLLPDQSIGYFLLDASGFQYMIFIFIQMSVMALRYRRAHALEIVHLKAQIRPHFIHNALMSIISISRNNPDRARKLLVDFSNYLRGFYDYEQDELVSIAQELELIYAYVALTQARFGEKDQIIYQIEAEDFLLPSLILQPLVENAFVHGLRGVVQGGKIIIYAKKIQSNKIRIGVRDNGCGFSNSTSDRTGVGIENINRRLSRLYHTNLIVLTPQGGGCEVYFEIPFKEASKNENTVN